MSYCQTCKLFLHLLSYKSEIMDTLPPSVLMRLYKFLWTFILNIVEQSIGNKLFHRDCVETTSTYRWKNKITLKVALNLNLSVLQEHMRNWYIHTLVRTTWKK